jgi:hypothetical protein
VVDGELHGTLSDCQIAGMPSSAPNKFQKFSEISESRLCEQMQQKDVSRMLGREKMDILAYYIEIESWYFFGIFYH